MNQPGEEEKHVANVPGPATTAAPIIAPTTAPVPPPKDKHDPFAMREFKLNWAARDIEQRFGFRGGRFTTVNRATSFLGAVVLTTCFYAALIYGLRTNPAAEWFCDMFLERGICPYPTVLLFMWGIVIIAIKARKLEFQERALALAAVPQHPEFVLNRETAREVLERVHSLVDSTAHFMLLNRIERALSNLKNIGQASDVSTLLRNQAEYDEQHVNSSFNLLSGFIWAIPVLGFIGTVLGLSQAIGAFGTTLRSGTDTGALKDSLEAVTAGLSTAFETTLIALVGALILQLLMTHQLNREQEFLDACNDFCHANVASKLRLLPVTEEE